MAFGFLCGTSRARLRYHAGAGTVVSRGPVREDVAAKSLENKLAFPCGAEVAVPVCLVPHCYGATSATHTLVTCDFGDIDQNWLDGNVVSGDVVRG